MKKNQLVQFGLSALFAAVLAACGGSGKETKPADNNGKVELTEEQKLALELQKKKEGWLQAAGNNNFVNFQTLKNNESDVGTNPISIENNYHNNTPGTNEKLHSSLDTIVISTPRSNKGVTAYLEDFHFYTVGAPVANPSAHIDVAGLKALTDEVKAEAEASLVNQGSAEYAKYFADAAAANKEELAKALAAAQAANYTPEQLAAVEEGYKALQNSYEELALIYGAGQLGEDAAADVKLSKEFLNTYFSDLGVEKLALVSGITVKPRNGEIILRDVYVNQASTHGGAARPGEPEITETGTQGRQSTWDGTKLTAPAVIYALEPGRDIYFTVDKATEAKGIYNYSRVLAGTVGEVYGAKTYGIDINNGTKHYTIVDDAGDNAPFQYVDKDGKYHDGQLNYVQYGRVTSALHGVQPADLKDGVLPNTKVASYGEYGNKGTENHYFARGLEHTATAEVAKLSGKLNYYGHAVAYGLDNTYNGFKTGSDVPNAIAAGAAGVGIVSGNHVKAVVDLESKDVMGSVYNVWANGTDKLVAVDLVKFEGKVGANGNMVGESKLTYRSDDAAKGDFKAGLFGPSAEEMAGKVQSNSLDAKDGWVAVFGATRGAAPVAGSPWDPRNEYNVDVVAAEEAAKKAAEEAAKKAEEEKKAAAGN